VEPVDVLGDQQQELACALEVDDGFVDGVG
jgi:hypothetical protein